jgi:hypothetical protein
MLAVAMSSTLKVEQKFLENFNICAANYMASHARRLHW